MKHSESSTQFMRTSLSSWQAFWSPSDLPSQMNSFALLRLSILIYNTLGYMEDNFVLSDFSFHLYEAKNTRENKLSDSDVVLTLISSTVGIGFLLLPIAFAFCGWGLSILVSLAVMVLQANANYSLVRVASKLKLTSYPLVVERLIGRKWLINVFNALLFSMNLATTIVYMITIVYVFLNTMIGFSKSNIALIREIGFVFDDVSPELLAVFLNIFLFLFVAFKNKFLMFSKLALGSFCALLFAMACVSTLSVIQRNPKLAEVEMSFSKPEGIPYTLHIFVFSFMNSPSVVELYNEREKKNVRKFKRLLYYAFGLIFAIFTAMSMFVYYGSGDLLIGYQRSNILLAPYFNNFFGEIAKLFVVGFLFVNAALRLIPIKEMMLRWIGLENRTSHVFHILTMSVLILLTTLATVAVLVLEITLRNLVCGLVLLIAPMIGYHFPFFAFISTFSGFKSETRRTYLSIALMFTGIFVHALIIFESILQLLIR